MRIGSKGKPRGLSTWSPTDRFWRNVQKTDGCWWWVGAKSMAGYGVLTGSQSRLYAHRFSYELHHQPLTEGQVVCHRCDHPSCVNPYHLFAGTIADNNRDMWAKGRGKGLDPHNGKLTVEQRRYAVARVMAGETKTKVAQDLGVTRQAISHLVKAGIYV